jgi:flagellum-specific peptidoglycan hydrolase FlgJ
MFYKFDKNELKYIKVKWTTIGLNTLAVLSIIVFIFGWTFKRENKQSYNEEEVLIFTAKQNAFTNEKFIDEIKHMNFKFPHIVYAQALLETGRFKKPIFVENNNLFGMKEAIIRVNTSLGTENGHATYKNWRESLIDYALYYATYLSRIDNEDDYISYLSQKYAEDPNYANKLRELIKTENLKQKLN